MTTKPLAVVTGASSGIGRELAMEFARNGFDLFLTSGSERLAHAVDDVSALGADVTSFVADLTNPNEVEALAQRIRTIARPVDALVLNAGVGVGGDFAFGTDLNAELAMIDLNVRSTVHLCKLLVKDMVSRGEGRILFTSSIASTMAGPFEAVYAASKSFVQSFAIALREELKDSGVTVTSLMPGPTQTDFFHRAGMDHTRVGQSEKDDAAQVARQGFKALMADKAQIVAGSLKTKTMGALNEVLPEAVKAKMHKKMSEPLPPDARH